MPPLIANQAAAAAAAVPAPFDDHRGSVHRSQQRPLRLQELKRALRPRIDPESLCVCAPRPPRALLRR